MQEPDSDQDKIAPKPRHLWGCLLPLVGAIWVVVITFSVPIGADRYSAPHWLKLMVLIGHAMAILLMYIPSRNRSRAQLWVAVLLSIWAGMNISTIWFWN